MVRGRYKTQKSWVRAAGLQRVAMSDGKYADFDSDSEEEKHFRPKKAMEALQNGWRIDKLS
eukprot:6721245-Prorocentrum_lima.AAC.1